LGQFNVQYGTILTCNLNWCLRIERQVSI